MKVYTRTGDAGMTSLVGGSRVSKSSERLEAYGTIDELNSWIGLIATMSLPVGQREVLIKVMSRLFDVGTILATESESSWQPEPISSDTIEDVEKAIDILQAELPQMRSFILPTGTADSAHVQIARTIARRAERRILAFLATISDESQQQKILSTLPLINRLSDYLFVLARAINCQANVEETPWKSPKE